MRSKKLTSATAHCAALAVFCLSAGTLAAQAGGGCQNIPVVWTIYNSYVDPGTGLTMQSAITGDGVQVDGSGNSLYSSSSGKVSVSAWMNVCGTHPSYDAILNIFKGRGFNASLASQLDNDYAKFPPQSAFLNKVGLLNVSDIRWCQNHALPNGCTFYTRFTSAITGSDGKTYHLRMETGSSVPVTSWTADATADCAYATSPVKVVFTPAALSASGKDTYEVTPVLQGTNTGSGWTAPPLTAGCPTPSLLGSSWPAATGVLIQDGTGDSYNFGQYHVPFKFVIQNQ